MFHRKFFLKHFLTSEFPGKNPETRFQNKKNFQNGFRHESCNSCSP
ncbi:hypothetical protein LEP1GSC026_2166 [Leptospira interrogans str. 2002000623]|nr:hypothetical protein LEP1GSC026_2166 [Leptospira interrogans str. 2002000623]